MDYDTRSVRSGNYHTLTLATPIVHDGKEPSDYNSLYNKPSINGIELIGDMSLESLGIASAASIEDVPTEPLTQDELDNIIGE